MPPIVAQYLIKTELLKLFTRKPDDDIYTWLYGIDLYFKAENRIL